MLSFVLVTSASCARVLCINNFAMAAAALITVENLIKCEPLEGFEGLLSAHSYIHAGRMEDTFLQQQYVMK